MHHILKKLAGVAALGAATLGAAKLYNRAKQGPAPNPNPVAPVGPASSVTPSTPSVPTASGGGAGGDVNIQGDPASVGSGGVNYVPTSTGDINSGGDAASILGDVTTSGDGQDASTILGDVADAAALLG